MENYKLLTILEDIISGELKEIDPRTTEQAAATVRRLVRGGTAEAKKVAQEIVKSMNLGGVKGEAINIFGKLDASGKKFVKSNTPTAVTTGDDLLAALKKGAIDAENLARVNKGILKSESATSTMLQDIVGPVVRETKFVEKYGALYVKKPNGEQAARELLRNNGYSQRAIDEMFKVIKTDANYGKNVANIEKNLSKAKEKIKQKDQLNISKDREIAELKSKINTNVSQTEAVKVIETSSKEIPAEMVPIIDANKNRLKEMSKTAFDKFKNVGKKLSLKWAFGLGLVGVGGFLGLKSLFGGTTKPDGTNTIHPKCISDLLDDNGTSVSVTSTGDPVVVVKKTGNSEYDNAGGLMFYTNGRVFSGNKKMRGTWKCKDGELAITETVNEQTDSEIDSDVNTMINLLDFPVSGRNLQDAVSLLKKYSTSPKGKEFLDLYKDSGLGTSSLKKSLDYISTFEPTSVRAKRTMYKLISQIEGGVGVADGDRSTGIGNISITWDSQAKKEDNKPKIDDEKPKPIITYKKCESFPFQFGCKSPMIADIQKCLDVRPTHGNFGPKTLKALKDNKHDVSNGITEELYNLIMDNCESGEREVVTPITGVEPIIPKSEVGNNLKLTKIGQDTIDGGSSDEFYTGLVKQGYIVRMSSDEINDGRRRIKYKGPDLDDLELGKLDTALNNRGYDRIKDAERSYGSKYVYLRRD